MRYFICTVSPSVYENMGFKQFSGADKMMKFEGVYTALVTPFRNGEVDYEALKKLVELQVAGRVSGIVPVGTTG